MDLTVDILRKNTLNVTILNKDSITVDIVRKNTLSCVIDTPVIPVAPVFVSAEVGLIDAYTIDMLFNRVLNESSIPAAGDFIPVFSGGATSIYDLVISGLHVKAKTGLNDLGEWFLPSKDELNLMYINLHLFGVGNFGFPQDANFYWSSSELNVVEYFAYYQGFNDGSVDYMSKTFSAYIRPCRSFTSLVNYNLRDIGPFGGWIFYKDGNNYLECYRSNIPNTSQQGSRPWSNIYTANVGTSTAIGTGAANTAAIIAQVGHTSSAALLCTQVVTGRAIAAGETGTIQYVPGVNKLKGATGGNVVAFTEDVTNNVPASIPVCTSITIADATPDWVDFNYDLSLDGTSVPANTVFAISGKTNTGVPVISGTKISQQVTVRFYWGDTATGAYTKPGTNMIKSTLGGEADSFTAIAITNNCLLDTYAEALINREIAVGEARTLARKQALNIAIIALRAADCFETQFDDFVVTRGYGAASTKMNWIGNFTNALGVNNPTRSDGVGYSSNGTTSYLRSQYIPATNGVLYTQDNACFGFKISGTIIDNSGHGYVNAPSVNVTFVRTDIPITRINNSTGISGSINREVGYNCLSRADSTKFTQLINATSTDKLLAASSSIALLGEPYLLRVNYSSSFSCSVNEVIEMYWFGKSITQAKFLTMQTIMNTYFASL